ncbi:MAG: dihydrofolate reductase family protein [Nocardioides sp.]
MGRVIMFAAVSLDGFVADEQDAVGPLFDWYANGDVPVHLGDAERVFHTSARTADFLQDSVSRIGVCVVGRRLFDLTNGWHGRPPSGDHVVVVTHEAPTDWEYADQAPFTFATDGLAPALEQARMIAGDRDVSLTAGDIGGQALREGLVDRVVLNLVPAVLGSGRPFFGSGALVDPILLENPTIVAGDRVTHLTYDVRR